MKNQDIPAQLGSPGNRLRAARKHFDLNRTQFGRRLGVQPNTVSRYELDQVNPSMRVMDILSKEFGISMDWLLFHRGPWQFKKKNVKEKDPAAEHLTGELLELFRHMVRIPLLRHEVLTLFHKFKIKNKDIIAEAMSEEKE